MSRKEHLYHFIYKTIDTRNGNFYIGMHSTNNLNDGYVGSGTRLRRLIYKHGKEIFNMEILEFLPDRSSLKEREKEIINSNLLKEEKCMNLKEGGEGGLIGLTEDCILKIRKGASDFLKNKWNDIEFRNHICEISGENMKKYHKEGKIKYDTFTGKHHTDETKKLISSKSSLNQKGNKNSQFNTMWITNGFENKKIKKEEPIPNGYILGRKIVHRSNG